MNADDKARLARAHSCFNLANYYRNLGNEILRPVRERPFATVKENLTVDTDRAIEPALRGGTNQIR